jgi:probable F420-dependent oxidoreductase
MTDVQRRHGITIPFAGIPLHEHAEWFALLAAHGYTDVSAGEAGAHDAFAPLVLAAVHAPDVRVSQSILPVSTRGPALLAQSIATLCEIAPGRVAVGIGASSNVIVERWNGIPFEKPLARVRDTIRFLRAALAGEKITETYETFSVSGFRPEIVPTAPPPILVAALRQKMLRLAGTEGDGAILNWLAPDDVPRVSAEVGPGKEIMCRVFVYPTDDFALVRKHASRHINAYLNVPVYRAFHEWLGRTLELSPMWDAWAAGDRKLATEVIPDDVIDQLVVWGDPARLRAGVERYCDMGVTTPVPMIMTNDRDALRRAIDALAPSRPLDSHADRGGPR